MRSKPASLTATIMLGLMLVTGCTGAPPQHDVQTLPFNIAPQWQISDTEIRQAPSTGWIHQLGSSDLEQWVRQALKSNASLLEVSEKLKATGYRQQQINSSGGLQIDSRLSADKAHGLSGNRNDDTEGWILHLDMSWEFDLWGKQEALEEQARWQRISVEHEFRYQVFSLTAQIAQAWITIAELSLLEVLQQNALNNWKAVVNSVRRNVARGQVSNGDLQYTLTELALAESALEQTRRQLGKSARNIKIILGQYPTFDRKRLPTELPEVPEIARMDSPARIMMQRPDILMAQAHLAATDAAASAAYADLFPRLSLNILPKILTGDLSGTSSQESTLTTSANLLQPLLDRRTLKARVNLAASQADQAFWRYTDTLLNAFFEVEQTAHNTLQMKREWQAIERAQSIAIKVAENDKRDYQRGLKTLRDYLSSQRRVIELSQQAVNMQADCLRNWVALQLALGRPSLPENVRPEIGIPVH
ncbi:hypothetical protein BTA51_14780 [Hahella sp. CCB-MM4]|uniref:TolC family protein n=1 Tax=Hahella sp. (strain CCB-MM4) TaxID=1926491 RepID=UPI000B9C123C|nr:TolC family protein [Hahella sp. CCB-MM4]OZG72782.1 hypothetical protein BTA51_14780 [Hahella sp. CCB-MM4]